VWCRPPVSWERMLSAVRWGRRGLRDPGLRPGRRGAGTGGGCSCCEGVRRAEARLLATMALVRELRGRLGVDACGARVGCRPGTEMDRSEELRAGGVGRPPGWSVLLSGDMGRDGTDEADTNVSVDDAELCDGRRGDNASSMSCRDVSTSGCCASMALT
jgi:hypothetical protein